MEQYSLDMYGTGWAILHHHPSDQYTVVRVEHPEPDKTVLTAVSTQDTYGEALDALLIEAAGADEPEPPVIEP